MSLPFSSSLASLPPTVPAAKLSRRLSAGTACLEQQTCLRSGGEEKREGSRKVAAVSPPHGGSVSRPKRHWKRFRCLKERFKDGGA